MKFLIRKFLLISILSACFANMLMSMDIGAYLAPKFIFNVGDSKIKLQGNTKNTLNMYVGGGLAIGYNFDIFHKYSTVRVEFEYLYRNSLPGNIYLNSSEMQAHSFLFGGYYDFNFFHETFLSLTTEPIVSPFLDKLNLLFHLLPL